MAHERSCLPSPQPALGKTDCAPARRGYVPPAPSGPIWPPRDCLRAPATPHGGCRRAWGRRRPTRKAPFFFALAPGLRSAEVATMAEAHGSAGASWPPGARGLALALAGEARRRRANLV